jgi:hypothetical protein
VSNGVPRKVDEVLELEYCQHWAAMTGKIWQRNRITNTRLVGDLASLGGILLQRLGL